MENGIYALADLLLERGASANAVDSMGRAAILLINPLISLNPCHLDIFKDGRRLSKNYRIFNLLMRHGATMPDDPYGLQ